MKKVPGFSLTELVVVMLLTGIVVSFSYKGLEILEVYFAQYRKQTQEVNDLTSLHKQLIVWMNNSKTVRASDEKLIFQQDSSQINVTFEEKKVLVHYPGLTDTLHVVVTKKVFLFDGSQQFVDNGLITEIDIEASLRDETYPIWADKEYDAETLMNESHERN